MMLSKIKQRCFAFLALSNYPRPEQNVCAITFRNLTYGLLLVRKPAVYTLEASKTMRDAHPTPETMSHQKVGE